jgi:hypothetical protein
LLAGIYYPEGYDVKKENAKIDHRKSDRAFRLWGLGAIGLGVLIGVGILIFHKPNAYNPVRPDNPEQVSLYLTHELGPEFFNQVQLEKPFDLIIEQHGLNDIISRLDWIQQLGPLSLQQPNIIFADRSILLMGTLQYRRVSSVLSILALPTMDANQQICMNIQSVRLGMVPVTSLVSKLSQKAFDDNRDGFKDDPEVEKIVQAIIRNEPFDPVFRISEYQVRITHFTLENNVLKLTLLPEKMRSNAPLP